MDNKQMTVEDIYEKALTQLALTQQMYMFQQTNFSSGELAGATFMCLAIGIPKSRIDEIRERVKAEFEYINL
jgi:hypothetical protein